MYLKQLLIIKYSLNDFEPTTSQSASKGAIQPIK